MAGPGASPAVPPRLPRPRPGEGDRARRRARKRPEAAEQPNEKLWRVMIDPDRPPLLPLSASRLSRLDQLAQFASKSAAKRFQPRLGVGSVKASAADHGTPGYVKRLTPRTGTDSVRTSHLTCSSTVMAPSAHVARDNRVAPEVCQSVSGRVRGSPKRVMTLVVKPVMAVMWSPAVVMTRRAVGAVDTGVGVCQVHAEGGLAVGAGGYHAVGAAGAEGDGGEEALG